MGDPFHDLAERYNSSGEILRQVVRHELTGRGLAEHLPGAPARIADVGGGAGQQAIPLSRRGYEVTIIDPSPKMLAEARQRLVHEEAGVRRRVRFVDCIGERAHETLGGETFDAVLCHGVLMYLERARPMIHALSALLRSGGIVSVLAKNATALALRPALEGRGDHPRGHRRGPVRGIPGGRYRSLAVVRGTGVHGSPRGQDAR